MILPYFISKEDSILWKVPKAKGEQDEKIASHVTSLYFYLTDDATGVVPRDDLNAIGIKESEEHAGEE